MNQVRIHGDPFGDDQSARLLRSFLRLALGSGVRCALSPVAADLRLEPWNGVVRDLSLGTSLPAAEVELLLRAAEQRVAATSPVLVFDRHDRRADAVREAGLAWPRATAILPARDDATAADLLERVRAELRWAGSENPPHALEERELVSWLALPAFAVGGPIVGVVGEIFGDGVDLTIATWRQHFVAKGTRLRLVVAPGDPTLVETVCAALGSDAVAAEVLVANFEPGHARDAIAVVLPWRRLRCSRDLVVALASGRPVCASRMPETSTLLAAPGTWLPVGGRSTPAEPGIEAHFAPHPGALRAALLQAIADPVTAAAIGRRARTFVVEELTRGRPASPPPAVRAVPSRPTVVLEAPFFATSASAELAIETARALCRRDRVELRLVPTTPLRTRLAALRERAPELETRLGRDPGDVDLWLACGWPPRTARPACGTFALCVDHEHGSLPWVLEPSAEDAGDLLAATAATLPARPGAGLPGEAAAIAIEELAFAAMDKRRPGLPVVEPVFTLPQAAVAAVTPQLAPSLH